MFKCNFEANKPSGRLNRITGFYQIKPALIRQYFASLNNTVNFEDGARHEGEEMKTAAVCGVSLTVNLTVGVKVALIRIGLFQESKNPQSRTC